MSLLCPQRWWSNRLKSPCSRLPTRPPTFRTALPPTARARRSRRRSLPCRRVREHGSISSPDGSQPCPAQGRRRKFAEESRDHAATGERNPGMIAKLLLQNSIVVVALGALLFASAGTLD